MKLELTKEGINRLWLNQDFKNLMEEVKTIRDRHARILLGTQLSDIDYAYHRGAHNTLDEVVNIIQSFED